MAEMHDIKEIRRRRNRKRAVKRLVWLTVVCVVIAVVYIGVVYIQQSGWIDSVIDQFANPTSGYPVSQPGGNPMQLYRAGGGIGVLTDTNFAIYQSSGRESLNVQHHYTTPAVKTYEDTTFLYETGGKSLMIYDGSKERLQKAFDYALIDACPGPNGLIGVALESQRYLAEVTVYDRNGEDIIFQWLSADYHVGGITLSPDGKSIAIQTVRVQNGELRSSILFFRFDQKEQIGQVDFDSTLLLSVSYKSSDRLFVVGDNQCAVVSTQGEVFNQTDFGQGAVLALYNPQQEGLCAIIQEDYKQHNTATLQIYDSNGELLGSSQVDARVRSVDIEGSSVILLANGTLSVFDREANLWAQCTTVSDAIFAIRSGNYYVLGLSEIYQEKPEQVQS